MYVALLRAVNVGGHKVAMADLRTMVAGLGHGRVRTLLNSGNVLFSATGEDSRQLEEELETESAKQLRVPTDFMVRSAADWAGVIGHNPFPEEAESDPAHVVVVCLKAAPQAAEVDGLQAAITGRELVRCHGRQLYVTYPDGIGASRLTMPVIEKRLGTRGTGRNWNTVLKIAQLLSG
mgnify:CR=1 FL=1